MKYIIVVASTLTVLLYESVKYTMKRTLSLLVIMILVLALTACGDKASETTEGATPTTTTTTTSISPAPSNTPDELGAALQAAGTVEEVGQIMKPYTLSGDYEAQIRCVDRMLEIDPKSNAAWTAKAEIALQKISEEQEKLKGLMQESLEVVDDPAGYVGWVKQYAENIGLTIELPFVHDYASEDKINTYGVSSTNYYNGGGVFGEWYNGLLTSQGDWIYYSVPDQNYAIYKMRMDGQYKQRLGDDSGCSLNVVGDWIYYCNFSENNCIFKMRTDGSERTQLSDDACKYLAVCGEWIVYTNMNEGDSLYKMRLDGSNRTLVVQTPVMYPYLYGERIYFKQRDERSLYSVAPDGSDLKQLVSYIEGYFIEDDWIYYITDIKGMVVQKMRPDGSDDASVFRFSAKGGFALYLDGSLIVNDSSEGSDHEQAIAVDLNTMKQRVLVDEWCELFYTAGNMGYYLNYDEGHVWYYVILATGETGKLE